MSPREAVGLALLIAAFAVAPFAYWLSVSYAVVALALAVPGVLLMATGRASRKLAGQKAMNNLDTGFDVPPGVHDVKGYPGSIVFHDHDGDVDTGHG
jgi:hypothetical protein